ncbi:MAG TPA: hypothetical protein VNA25_02455 [Phycisphaerae bacterium]|nr:hypothetical protein [Phycisphaerae bacterium]
MSLEVMDIGPPDDISDDLFVCRVCGDTFDRGDFWHCHRCAHHWFLSTPECKNCHKEDAPDESDMVLSDMGKREYLSRLGGGPITEGKP